MVNGVVRLRWLGGICTRLYSRIDLVQELDAAAVDAVRSAIAQHGFPGSVVQTVSQLRQAGLLESVSESNLAVAPRPDDEKPVTQNSSRSE